MSRKVLAGVTMGRAFRRALAQIGKRKPERDTGHDRTRPRRSFRTGWPPDMVGPRCGASPSARGSGAALMLPIEVLDSAVPAIEQQAEPVCEQVTNTGRSNLTADFLLDIAQTINEIHANDGDAAGAVVATGTDTIEETAYFLNLTVDCENPVVLVGAMRNSSALSTDGP